MGLFLRPSGNTATRLSVLSPSPVLVFYVVLFGVMLWLNHLTPLWGDDWWRAVDWRSFSDVFSRTQGEYQGWTGRISVLLLTYFSLLKYPGSIFLFNCVNAIVFVLLVRGIYRCAVGRYPQARLHDLVLLFITFVAVWFLTQALGEAVFWKTGGIAYLWVVCASIYWLQVFVDMMVYRRLRPNSRFKKWLLPFLVFALALSLENVSLSILAFMSFALLHAKHRGLSLPSWYRWNFLAFCIGVIVLIAAPGNFKRFDAQDDGMDIFQRFSGLLAKVWEQGTNVSVTYLIIFGLAALVALIGKQDFQRLRCLYLWILIGLMFALSMIVSTGINYHDRTAFAGEICFIIVVVGLAYEVLRPVKDSFFWTLPLVTLLLTIFIADFVPSYEKFLATHQQHIQRLTLMQAYRQFGVDKILLPSMRIPTIPGLKDDIVDGAYFLRDVHIKKSGNEWRNSTYGQYYGFKFATRVATPYLIFVPQLRSVDYGFLPVHADDDWLIVKRLEQFGYREYLAMYTIMPQRTCPANLTFLATDKQGNTQQEKISRSSQVAMVDYEGKQSHQYCVFRKEIEASRPLNISLRAGVGAKELETKFESLAEAKPLDALPAFLRQKKKLSWSGCRLPHHNDAQVNTRECTISRSDEGLAGDAKGESIVTFGPYAQVGVGSYKVYISAQVLGQKHRYKVVLHSDSAQLVISESTFKDSQNQNKVFTSEFVIDNAVLRNQLGIRDPKREKVRLEVVTLFGGEGRLAIKHLGVDINL